MRNSKIKIAKKRKKKTTYFFLNISGCLAQTL